VPNPSNSGAKAKVRIKLCASAWSNNTPRTLVLPRTLSRVSPRSLASALTHSAVAARSLYTFLLRLFPCAGANLLPLDCPRVSVDRGHWHRLSILVWARKRRSSFLLDPVDYGWIATIDQPLLRVFAVAFINLIDHCTSCPMSLPAVLTSTPTMT